MSNEVDDQRIRRIADLRELLEKRIRNLEDELSGLKGILSFVDELLLEKGFRQAGMPVFARPVEIPQAPPSPPQLADSEQQIPLKTVAGDPLATIHVNSNSMRVVLAKDKKFDRNTPPFTSFLVERVLEKMKEADRKAAKTEELPPDTVLSYDIVGEENLIRELIINHMRSERVRELKSAIRWTLEKMYDQMIRKGQ